MTKNKNIDKYSKYAFGVCSNTEDDKHIIMLDFDNIHLDNVYNTIINMQSRFNLSNFYLIKSAHGYNAFCLSKRKILDIYLMLLKYKHIDKQFIELAYKLRGFFVLRMGKDKHLIDIIKPESYKYFSEELSNSHKIFFEEIMKFKISNRYNYDNSTIIKIIAFKSKKHGMVYL